MKKKESPKPDSPTCSFCDRTITDEEVGYLVTSPNANICDGCVLTCVGIITSARLTATTSPRGVPVDLKVDEALPKG